MWDWTWYYYIGTVVLNMTEEVFWRTTPRKFFALLGAHNRANTNDESEEKKPNKEVPRATLEDMKAWAKKR